MILYLDTSALVKAYLTEPFRQPVLSAISKAEVVATHMLAYVEAHATFARLLREGGLPEPQVEVVKRGIHGRLGKLHANWYNPIAHATSR